VGFHLLGNLTGKGSQLPIERNLISR
jgi:hypothetical protein